MSTPINPTVSQSSADTYAQPHGIEKNPDPKPGEPVPVQGEEAPSEGDPGKPK